ncbi:MAG: 4-hydroxy-tetrahydrodipicolinate reductase [Planctomycetota bacterium]|nr:MAG: 4-hydroxy-tetrahydrodipicolinate reductase [Planctomycetota bacterium]
MIRLAVAGATGRMGSRIIELAGADQRFDLVAALEATGHPKVGKTIDIQAQSKTIKIPIQDHTETEFDILIDFSLPAGTMHWLEYCLHYKRAMVIGTTGHTPDQIDEIEKAAKNIPLLKASNMSVGVNLMFKLAGQIAAILGDDYNIEIVETHHRFKKDAPSGTALTLRDSIIKTTGRNMEKDVIYGRHGQIPERPARQIGIHALRVGDTVGEHEVHFGNLGETVILKHNAHTRDTFVNGALRAAAWLAGKPAGRYDMLDVLEMT